MEHVSMVAEALFHASLKKAMDKNDVAAREFVTADHLLLDGLPIEIIRSTSVSPELHYLERRSATDCRFMNARTVANRADYLADYDASLALQIVCQEERFLGTGCTLHFPFKGFAVRLSFHLDHLQ
jgi:hypothetical protein